MLRREYIQSVDDSGNITKNRQQDVDEEIGTAASLFCLLAFGERRTGDELIAYLEENTNRWEDDGENDLADVAREMSASEVR